MEDIEKLKEELAKRERKREQQRKASKVYYERKKQDPEWLEMQRTRQRDYNLRHMAKDINKFNEYHRNYYHQQKLKFQEAEAKLKMMEVNEA